MGVDEVVVLLINAADHGLGLRVVAEIASEPLLQLLPHPVADLIGPGGGQLGHVVLHLLVILGQRQQEPLQVAGDQDVHGGRDGVVEGAVAVIAAGADEVSEHIVAVGGADQPVDRDPISLA